MRYQTHLPTIALEYRDNHHAAVTIPAGKMINLVGQAEDGFLVVEVDGEQLRILESDLMDRMTAGATRAAERSVLDRVAINRKISRAKRNRTCLR